MKKILILQGGLNEEHKVSINTANEVAKVLTKLKIDFIRFTVNPKTFVRDISRFSNKHICFNSLHGSFGEDGKIQKILKKKVLVLHIQIKTLLLIVLIKLNPKKLLKNIKF